MLCLTATLGLRTAIAASLLCIIASTSGCSGSHTTEAAGTDGSISSRAEAATVSVQPVKSVATDARTATPPESNSSASVTTANTNSQANVTTGGATVTKGRIDSSTAKSEPVNSDEGHRKRIVGKWLQQKEEKRTITVKEDGTALIVAELNDYRQYIVGKTLEFDVKWTLEDGKLSFVTTGGRPAESIKYITKLFGESRVYRIVEFVEDGLMLKKDESGEDEPKWTKLEE